MSKSENLNLTKVVSEFVENLNGRYRKDISDTLLQQLLVNEIKREYSTMHFKNKRLRQAAYNAGAYIFESLLECKCHYGGNGHHVAQNLSKMFKDGF